MGYRDVRMNERGTGRRIPPPADSGASEVEVVGEGPVYLGVGDGLGGVEG